MKSTAFVTALALAAAVFSVAADAQTGRPSAIEAKSTSDTPQAVVADAELGSYARYLMLNGAPRDRAIAEARNVDHADTHARYAVRSRAKADAASPQ